MSTPSVVATGGSDPSARITRVEHPIASPGSCVICGKNEHPLGFAATDNLDFEFYGTVYFCADCVGDYARVFGFISPKELEQLRDHLAAQELELNTLRKAVLGLESTVDGLVADAHRRSESRASDIRTERAERDRERDASSPMDEQDAGPAQPLPTEPSVTPGDTAGGPAQPRNEQGRNDVFNTDSADELLGLA